MLNKQLIGADCTAENAMIKQLTGTDPSSRAEGILFLHGLESNPGSPLQTEEAGLSSALAFPLDLGATCLENPMDGGAWWAAVHGVTKSRTRQSNFTFTFHFHR